MSTCDAASIDEQKGYQRLKPNENGLFEYQVPHVNHMFNVFLGGDRAIDASDMGSGKSFTSIYLCLLLGLRPFVVCPKSVLLVWMEVAALFGVEICGVSNYEMLKGGKYYKSLRKNGSSTLESVECPWITKHHPHEVEGMQEDSTDSDSDSFEEIEEREEGQPDLSSSSGSGRKRSRSGEGEVIRPKKRRRKAKKKSNHWFEFHFPDDVMLILDEAHRMKNHRTATSKLLLAASKIKNKVLLLSATICDKLNCFPIFGVFFGLFDEVSDYGMWMRRRLAARVEEHDEAMLDDNQRRLDIIHRALLPRFGHRISIKDLGNLFPENQVIARCHYLAKSYEVQRLYLQLQEAFEDLKIKEMRAEALGKLIRIRQKIEILKIPIFLEMAQQFMDDGDSVIIFVNFNETMTQLAKKLKCTALVHGQQTLEERTWAINEFQSNRTNIIIVNIKAGGVGLSLHDLQGNHPRKALHNITWSGSDFRQCLGRAHRAGGKTRVQQFLIYVAESYEVDMCALINSKLHILDALNDGDLTGSDIDVEDIRHLEALVEGEVQSGE